DPPGPLTGPLRAVVGSCAEKQSPIPNRRVAELIAGATGARAVSEPEPVARRRWGDFTATLMRDVFVDAPRSRAKGWAPQVTSFEEAVALGKAFTPASVREPA
ncbi:MAG TPA: hypothetical protein VGV61_11010, partial [Thermoanaerobaculia bacterium]|nr:hypothetical protein [Thermoanaerobaculia bacterium]